MDTPEQTLLLFQGLSIRRNAVRPPSRRNNDEDIQDSLKETTTLLFSRKIATAAYNMWQRRCQLKYALPVETGNANQSCVYDLWLRNKLTDLSLSLFLSPSLSLSLPFLFLSLSLFLFYTLVRKCFLVYLTFLISLLYFLISIPT